MKRPDLETVLSPLKPFQRKTVDHAFHRLFLAKDSTDRFLVADEVGLGKTLVARGVIARAIDHLWETVDRIDIIYICSNQSIARANLPKLQVSGEEERSFALATRLTMLATSWPQRKDSRAWATARSISSALPRPRPSTWATPAAWRRNGACCSTCCGPCSAPVTPG
jgi:hypothetical protein